MPIPINGCYGGCMISTRGSSPKCYIRDTTAATPSCPSDSIQLSSSKDCVPCPLGCSSCTSPGLPSLTVTCTSCTQNYTLISSSGICGCINNYYLIIDPTTNKASCILKTQITATIDKSGSTNFTYLVTFSSNFYSRQSDLTTILPLITASLANKTISLAAITAVSTNQLSFSFNWIANIEAGSVLSLDFSAYNQIEGLSVQVAPSNALYTYTTGYTVCLLIICKLSATYL